MKMTVRIQKLMEKVPNSNVDPFVKSGQPIDISDEDLPF